MIFFFVAFLSFHFFYAAFPQRIFILYLFKDKSIS